MFSRTRQKIVLTIVTALILFLAATLGVIYVSSWLSIHTQNKEMLERYIALYSLESPPGENMPGLPPDIGASDLVPQPSGEITSDLPPQPSGEITSDLPQLPPDGASSDLPPQPSGEITSDLPQLPPDGAALEEPDAEFTGAIYRLSSFYSVAFSKDGEVLAVDKGNSGVYSKEEIIETGRTILSKNKKSGQTSHLLYRVDEQDKYTLVAFMDMTVTDSSMGKLLINILLEGAVAISILTFAAGRLARTIIGPLEENDRRQKQFISDAGHELKTPVAVINANAEILERQAGSSEWLENIKYENTRMGELVTGLLDLSRAENASVPMESVDLSRLAEREVLPFESVAFEQGLMIDSAIAPDIRVHGNPAQLRQLVSILVDNAIRHGKQGDTIRVVLAADRKNAVLSVTNQGDIPQEQLPRLFDRFYRVDEARAETGSHYGLGLSIAKAISEAHGGRIGVSSQSGEVRFNVSLPLERSRNYSEK